MKKSWNIGLCVTEAKMSKLGWGDVEATHGTRHEFTVARIGPRELDKDPRSTGLDILVFKLTDQIAVESHDACARAEIAAVESWLAAHPRVVQFDAITSQRRFHRRDALAAALEASTAGAVGARFPAQAVGGPAAATSFPALLKPMEACGVAAAHVMRIAFGPAAVAEYAASAEARDAGGFICQAFVNHDAVIYKVFCVGPRVVVQVRQSLPNLVAWDGSGAEPSPLLFDNAKPVAPQIASWHRTAPAASPPKRVPTQAELEELAAKVGKAFGAWLFGIDVIVDSSTSELVVIDANYFPSYRGCIDASQFFDSVVDLVESFGH